MSSGQLTIDGPIAVVAPSGAFDVDKAADGMDIARQAGFELHVPPDLLRRDRYLAAPDDHRLAQLVDALTSPAYSAVWFVRGGYGVSRLLSRLPLQALVSRPVIGFSDATALFCALGPRGLGPCVHGPMLHSLPATDEPSRRHLFAVLRGERPELMGTPWVDGEVQAPIVGGNLAMLAAMCGTPWQLDARGKILLVEDIGEAPYRVDRMLQQLQSAGVLDGIVGFGCGEFLKCDPPSGSTYTLRDVLVESLGRTGVPVVGELPFGHGAANRAFVWGDRATLGAGRLTFEAPDRPAGRVDTKPVANAKQIGEPSMSGGVR